MVRKRSARGRGPSRWWRASEALLKIVAGCAALLTLGSALEAESGALLGVGWRGAAWALVAGSAGAAGVLCARRARTLERSAEAVVSEAP